MTNPTRADERNAQVEALVKRINAAMPRRHDDGNPACLCELLDDCKGTIEELAARIATLQTTCETMATAAEIEHKSGVTSFRMAAAGLFLADGDSQRELAELRARIAAVEKLCGKWKVYGLPDDSFVDEIRNALKGSK